MLNRRGSRAALSASLLLMWLGFPSITARADDCCADLESRNAELEATTALKGNRRLTLEVSGLVNQGLLGWDDGGESNGYIVTNDNARTRFRFIGAADISADLQAGYRLEIGIRTANTKLVNQVRAESRLGNAVDLRESVWFLKSKSLGTLLVGATFPSFTNIADSNVT